MAQTFEELISSNLDSFYSAALCFTLDEGEAEELVQEAAIRAFNEFSRRRQVADFSVWMLGVLVGTYLERERRRGDDPLAETDGREEGPGDGTGWSRLPPFPEPGSREHGWLRGWLGRAWKELQAGDRLVLWLSDVERLRHARVAELVGIRLDQVRRRHYRARRGLSRSVREELQRRGVGEAAS